LTRHYLFAVFVFYHRDVSIDVLHPHGPSLRAQISLMSSGFQMSPAQKHCLKC